MDDNDLICQEVEQLELEGYVLAKEFDSKNPVYVDTLNELKHRVIQYVETFLGDGPELDRLLILHQKLEALSPGSSQPTKKITSSQPIAISSTGPPKPVPRPKQDPFWDKSFGNDNRSNLNTAPLVDPWAWDDIDYTNTPIGSPIGSPLASPRALSPIGSPICSPIGSPIGSPVPGSPLAKLQQEKAATQLSPPRRIVFGDPQEMMTCPICCDKFKRADCFAFEKCGHTYCNECLEGYINNKINENKCLDIPCPQPKCKETIQYCEVVALISDEMMAKYEQFSLQQALAADPYTRWCPKPECGLCMFIEPGMSRVRCYGCQYEFCTTCGEDAHHGTCEGFQKWKEENGKEGQKTSEWERENARPCPQCRAPTTKNSGCNHITCVVCGKNWCWLCSGDYTPNHYDLYNLLGCPGMQSGKTEDFNAVQRTGMRVAIGAGMFLGGVLAVGLAIPAAVIGGPIYGIYQLIKKAKEEEEYVGFPG